MQHRKTSNFHAIVAESAYAVTNLVALNCSEEGSSYLGRNFTTGSIGFIEADSRIGFATINKAEAVQY